MKINLLNKETKIFREGERKRKETKKKKRKCMIYFLCLSCCLSLIVFGRVNIKICYIYLCLLSVNVKDVNSRRSLFLRIKHRHFLCYRSLISGWLCFRSKAIFALSVDASLYVKKEKKKNEIH